MHRRSVLALAVSVPLAGCSALGLGGGPYIDDSVPQDEEWSFSADGGDVEITIVAEEFEPVETEDGEEIEHDVISVRIDGDDGPVFAESVEDEETFEATLEEGDYTVMTTGGTAKVTVEAV